MAISDVWVKGVGSHRGAPRIFLDAAQAIRAGFSPGDKVAVQTEEGRVVLSINRDGSRTLEAESQDGKTYTVSSRKKGEKTLPVLDINSKELLSIFEGMEAVRVVVQTGKVYLLPLASEVQKKERLERITRKMLDGQELTMGSLSHGGGVLSAAIHEGLSRAGVGASLAFANEIREDLLTQAREHNPAWNAETAALAVPMQEIVQDEWLMKQLPRLDILELGLPCSGASRAGKAKRGLSMMEDHPEVGHLVFAALAIINRVQPILLTLENVVDYSKSASAQILRHQLRDMGYDTHEAILSGKDFGCLENRIRWCLVATTRGMDFSFDQIAPTVTVVKTLADALEDIPLDDPRWSEMAGLKAKQERDQDAGKGFRMQVFTPDATSIGTITKGYAKVRSTDPKIAHPTDPNLLRQLTAVEHARLKGVSPELIAGLPQTTAHELLGQGIVHAPFEAVGHRIGECVLALMEKHGIKLEGDQVQSAPARRRIQSFGVG